MDRQKPKPKLPKHAAGIALEKFGKMKKSSFDKRAKLEKESKLNAARVNKYKKLKAKLADKLQPRIELNQVREEPGARARREACRRRRLLPPPQDPRVHGCRT